MMVRNGNNLKISLDPQRRLHIILYTSTAHIHGGVKSLGYKDYDTYAGNSRQKEKKIFLENKAFLHMTLALLIFFSAPHCVKPAQPHRITRTSTPDLYLTINNSISRSSLSAFLPRLTTHI